MSLTHGRASLDLKVQKSLGGTPYTNLFVITGVINELTTDFQLISPNTVLNPLPHAQLATPSQVYIASTSNSDIATGTGARVITITGLDTNYDVLEEVIIMQGQTPVQSINTFSRVFEMLIIQYGSNVDSVTGDSNCVGDLYIGTGTFTAGVPANPIVSILSSETNANSREAIYTVPDGKILLLKSLFAGADPDIVQNVSLSLQLSFRIFGFGQNQWFKAQPYIFDGVFQYVYEYNVPLPPRTDIQMRAKSTVAKTKTAFVDLACELRDLR